MDKLAENETIFTLIDFTLLEERLTAFNQKKTILVIAKDENIFIYDTQTKKQIHTLKSQDGTIKQLYFLPDDLHIIYATTNGHVVLSHYKHNYSYSLIFSTITKYKTQLPIQITAIAFYQHLLAIGSADGKVALIHQSSYETIDMLYYSNAAICALCFDDTNSLVIINSHGEIFTHDIEAIKATQRIVTNLSDTKQLLHIPKSDFLLINSHKKSLTLFDLKKQKIISNKYLPSSHPISYIELTQENHLIMALKNREILRVTLQNELYLDTLINNNLIPQAYTLVEKHPQLLKSDEYKKLEKIYTIEYFHALKALQSSNIQKAQKLLESCLKIQSKQDELKILFEAYHYYENFKTLVREKKFAPAYTLATKYPPLQYSKEYQIMEKNYKRAYKQAQKELFHSNLNAAKEQLLPYIGVLSKKEGINLILKENSVFLEFLEALKHNDDATIYKLLSTHPHFKNLPPYKEFQQNITKSLQTINQLLNATDISQARDLIQKLQHNSSAQKELSLLEKKADSIEKLLHLYEENKFKECYGLLDEKPLALLPLQLTHLLEIHWTKLMQECEKYALYGNIKKIKQTLQELLTLESRSKRVGDLLRSAFIVEIEKNITKQLFVSAENLIYSYIDIFGEDTNLQKIMHLYEKTTNQKLAITPNSTKVAHNAWLHNELIIS